MGADFFTALAVLLFLVTSGHALIHKRDPRSSLWWVSLNLFLPYIGPLLYYFFGINRIERKALRLKRKKGFHPAQENKNTFTENHPPLPYPIQHFEPLSKTLDGVIRTPLTTGNRVDPLIDGDAAYPAMLQAIDNANDSVGLSVYIFNNDQSGGEFIQALSRATKRGVQVRVLVDDVGAGFFWNGIRQQLKREHIPSAMFLPTFFHSKSSHFNLRNHRKILTVDGRVAFTGGMNIADEHCQSRGKKNYCRDVHFQLEGPVVEKIQETFRDDWYFASGEILRGPTWFPKLTRVGEVEARAIPDGPDETLRKTRWTILGALAHAKSSVRIMTPYFIPDPGLITALQMAVLNGVKVEIFLPKANDWVFVQWASQALLWQVLEIGCRVWEMPPPFHHSKLMLVDDGWLLMGSSNWDARSLRLNFEFNVECYDMNLGGQIRDTFDRHQQNAREIRLSDLDGRPLPIKLRDGFARLFAPVL